MNNKEPSERARPRRPTKDRSIRSGWVATDGTEHFLDMLIKDPAVERKLQANEVLTAGEYNLHPAILRALAAGMTLEEVAEHSNLPSEEIEKKLAADYRSLARIENPADKVASA